MHVDNYQISNFIFLLTTMSLSLPVSELCVNTCKLSTHSHTHTNTNTHTCIHNYPHAHVKFLRYVYITFTVTFIIRRIQTIIKIIIIQDQQFSVYKYTGSIHAIMTGTCSLYIIYTYNVEYTYIILPNIVLHFFVNHIISIHFNLTISIRTNRQSHIITRIINTAWQHNISR